MGTTKTLSSEKVPFGQKVAFGIGMLANQMFPAILGIFMVVLVQDLGFPGWMWGVLFFLPRIFDSITDPIMGFISDNTKSKWGRRRHYVFLGAVIMGISFVIMWQLYRENGVDYNFTYFLLWSFVFYLGLTIFSVPYVAMGYEMSNDFHERTDIMAIAQWIGQWAWVIAPWFWVFMYDEGWFPTAEAATRETGHLGRDCLYDLCYGPGYFHQEQIYCECGLRSPEYKDHWREFEKDHRGLCRGIQVATFQAVVYRHFLYL